MYTLKVYPKRSTNNLTFSISEDQKIRVVEAYETYISDPRNPFKRCLLIVSGSGRLVGLDFSEYHTILIDPPPDKAG